MLTLGYEGPKEQWQAELEKVNKLGLLTFIDLIVSHLDAITGGTNRDSLLKSIRLSKQYGKWDAAHNRHERYVANPKRFIDAVLRRSRAAKKAARRGKRGR